MLDYAYELLLKPWNLDSTHLSLPYSNDTILEDIRQSFELALAQYSLGPREVR
jgi:hypothetical protein